MRLSSLLSRPTPTLFELALLLLWLGGAILFSAVVAPALFATLPTRTLAGVVVGRVLPTVFYSGMIVGVGTAVVEWRVHGEFDWRGGALAGVAIFLACAVAQFIISPRIERVRATIGGALDSLAPDDPRRVEFGRLHAVSVAWLGIAMLCAALAAVAAARSLHRAVAAEHPVVPGVSDD